MLKKYCLAVLVALGCNQEVRGDDVVETVAAATIVATVGGTATYWMFRESNASLELQAEGLWNAVYPQLTHCCSLTDVQSYLYRNIHYKNKIEFLYKRLDARYGSYFKPWNWTSGMQKAYVKMQLLHVIFDNEGLVRTLMSLNNEQEAVRYMQRLYAHCNYPLIAAESYLSRDLLWLRRGFVHASFVGIVEDVLSIALQAVRSSAAYHDEKYRQRMEELARRQAAAAERAAWAAEKSAQSQEKTSEKLSKIVDKIK